MTDSTLALGDYRILELIENAGGVVVIEDFAEGINPYWVSVHPNGDLIQCLADCCFLQRVPPACIRPGKERLDFLIKLAQDFKVDSLIWNYLYNCLPMSLIAHILKRWVEKTTGVPTLALEVDIYDSRSYSAGTLRTKVEAFAEILRARKTIAKV